MSANLDRWHAARETRFVKMFASLTEDSDIVQAANQHIESHEKNVLARQKTLHNQWRQSIYDPIMTNVNHTVNPLPITKPSTRALDPVKSQLTSAAREQALSVSIDRLLFEHSPVRPYLLPTPPYPNRHIDPLTWSPAEYDGPGKKRIFREIDADAAGTKS